MDHASLFGSAELVPGSPLGSEFETVQTSYGSPVGLDYHLLEPPPLVFLALAPDPLSPGEGLPPAAVSEESAEELEISLQGQVEYKDYTTTDSVTGFAAEVDSIPTRESTPLPPADPTIVDPDDKLRIHHGCLKPIWIGNVLDDSIENIQLEVSDASENSGELQAFDASTSEIWLDDSYPEALTFQEENDLPGDQNDSESFYTQVDEPLAADIDYTPILQEYNDELSPFICYAYGFNPQLTFEIDPIPGTSDTPEAADISHDYSVLDADLVDDALVPLTGEKTDSVESFAEVLPWDESAKEPEIAICELEIFPYWQSILPTEELIDPAENWIDIPQEFSEVPAEILSSEESSAGTTLGTEDILTAEPCLQYPIHSVNSDYDDQFSINPQWPEPVWIYDELDHSPEAIQLETSDSSVDSEISDLSIEAFDASLPNIIDSISIDLPSIDGSQPTDFLEVDSPGNEWGQIPEIMICFLPDFDNSGLVPQPYDYDASTIDVVSEEADVAITQDSTDYYTPSRGGTTKPLPWWRGYTASPPENLSSQLLAPEELVENNDIWLDDADSESSTFLKEKGLSGDQNDSESPYVQVDKSLAVNIDHTPTPLEMAAISHDYSVICTELVDDFPVSLTGEKSDSVDSFAEVLPWDESAKEPEIAICELEIFPYWQSILPTEELIDPAEKWIDIPQEFPEVPAEILPGEESSAGTTLGTEDILTAEPCLQYPIHSVNNDYDDQFSINPQWPEPVWIYDELDHSPEAIQFETSDSSVDSETSDLFIETFDASLPNTIDGISIDLPSIDGPQPTDFLEVDSPGNEWGQIPEIIICFLPDFDNSGLVPQPYDASTIDVVSEEADVAITQDSTDYYTPSRGGTTTPMPWWRGGYAASSPENLSSQLLVADEFVENSDQAQASPDSILDSYNLNQAQPSPGNILDSDNLTLPVAIPVTALAESVMPITTTLPNPNLEGEAPITVTLRNPNPAQEDAAQGEVFQQPYLYMAHPFTFETTAPATSPSVEPQLFIDETTSTDIDFQNQSRNSADIIDLILSFNNMGSSGFTPPLLRLAPTTRLTNLLDLPPWLAF